jgi:hypothetical protein
MLGRRSHRSLDPRQRRRAIAVFLGSPCPASAKWPLPRCNGPPTAIDLSQSHFDDIGDEWIGRCANPSPKDLPMIKTILVPAMGNETDVTAFAVALRAARSFAAHFDVLHVRLDSIEVAVAMSADGGGGALSSGLIEELEQEIREREARAQQIFSEFCVRNGLTITASPAEGRTKPSAQWHVETGQEPRWMAAYGTTADLIVALRGSGDDAAMRSILEAVLLESGRPLLILGAAAPAVMMAEKIAIA